MFAYPAQSNFSGVKHPLELVRARFAAKWTTQPTRMSYVALLSGIVKQEGVLALYSGLRPTLVGIIPVGLPCLSEYLFIYYFYFHLIDLIFFFFKYILFLPSK